MTLEENKAIIHRHAEEWNKKNSVTAVDELVATDFISHDPNGDTKGSHALREFHQEQAKSYPDGYYTVIDLIAEGDKVAALLVYRYTAPNTGEKRMITGINLYRVADKKIQELWPVWREEQPDHSL